MRNTTDVPKLVNIRLKKGEDRCIVAINWQPIAEHLGFDSPYQMFVTLYNEHGTNSLEKMAEYLGVCPNSIIRQLKNLKIKIKPVGPPLKSKTNLLIEKREILKELTVNQIVERFGLSNGRAFRELAKRHNLEYKRVGKLYS